MKDRLQQLLTDKALTANKLAEILEVQPSGISHILAGRNKPSIDFVTKLLTAFPDLNPDWFILGIAPMYRSAIKHTIEPVQRAKQDIPDSTPAPTEGPEKTPLKTPAAVTPTADQQPTLDFDLSMPASPAPTVNPHTPSTAQRSAITTDKSQPAVLPGNPQKRIRKVMIFYTDHTVESFDYYADRD